ncbi:hypothetical protein, partial [Aliiroseovarius marinus]|uniref:hypothetical protein n=1 Tax=Aliiroseovarius marinus TaxID=2500159 RepID=UPI002494754E
VPLCASAPPVKWVLRLLTDSRKRFFQKNVILGDFSLTSLKNKGFEAPKFFPAPHRHTAFPPF